MATPIPTNSAEFSLAEIAGATGGEVLSAGPLGGGERTTAVSTDSRTISAGALFVALRGESFDGHEHLAAAVSAGARAVVVERDASDAKVAAAISAGAAVVKVESSLVALGALARAHARRWRALGGVRWTLAITGSAGKTTTRVATQALLSALHPGEVHATTGNLNNLVGAPMVLFGLRPEHRYAVIEIGMSVPGEIEALARIVEPDAGLVTLVAAAHVEALGSIEGVAHEKGALYRALDKHGVALGNADNPHVRAQMETSPAAQKYRYGEHEDADVRIVARGPKGLSSSLLHLRVRESDIHFSTPLLGEAGAYACAAAIAAVTCGFGDSVTSQLAEEAFASAEVGGGAGRLVPVQVGRDVVVIDDSYNANPASMKASIRAAAEIAADQKRRLILVLGEMRELGVAAEAGHDEVGDAARESGARLVIAVGPLAKRIANKVKGGAVTCAHAANAEEASALARQWVMPSDLVLVKGSRGIGTDAVVRALTAHLGSESVAAQSAGGTP